MQLDCDNYETMWYWHLVFLTLLAILGLIYYDGLKTYDPNLKDIISYWTPLQKKFILYLF